MLVVEMLVVEMHQVVLEMLVVQMNVVEMQVFVVEMLVVEKSVEEMQRLAELRGALVIYVEETLELVVEMVVELKHAE